MTTVEPEPTRYEQLRFAYGEVLDATKHQDDKVGRMLGAIAFLTGGALVFANKDVLQVDFEVGASAYPLAAIALTAFIIVDLLAVGIYMIGISAPLTLPGRGPTGHSHLFFRMIAAEDTTTWRALWEADPLAQLECELIDEIHNIARRADTKYTAAVVATNAFLAALILLAPTIVIGLAAAASDADGEAVDLNQSLRILVGGALAVGVLGLLISLHLSAHRSKSVRSRPLLGSVFCYPAFLWMMVVSTVNRGFVMSGQLTVVILGVISSASFLVFYWPAPAVVGPRLGWLIEARGDRALAGSDRARERRYAVAYAAVVVILTIASFWMWTIDRADWQLVIAAVGGVLVVTPNITSEVSGRRTARGSVDRPSGQALASSVPSEGRTAVSPEAVTSSVAQTEPEN